MFKYPPIAVLLNSIYFFTYLFHFFTPNLVQLPECHCQKTTSPLLQPEPLFFINALFILSLACPIAQVLPVLPGPLIFHTLPEACTSHSGSPQPLFLWTSLPLLMPISLNAHITFLALYHLLSNLPCIEAVSQIN